MAAVMLQGPIFESRGPDGPLFLHFRSVPECCMIKMCHCYNKQVLDEMLNVLRLVKTNPNPPRAHELLQELRDISSMAMEHFDEKIVPILKRKMPPVPIPFTTTYSPKSGSPLGTVLVN